MNAFPTQQLAKKSSHLKMIDHISNDSLILINSVLKSKTIKVLNKVQNIEDIDIKLLLKTINKRIESLYNRDHIIGHQFFQTLTDKKGKEAKDELIYIFKIKIIPLLQKYFNNDWEKIREILGDDKKLDENEKYQFIKRKQDCKVKELIEKEIYEINENAFSYVDSYKKIYE